MSNKRRAFKLKLLLGIDTAFLFLELGVGTVVGSLALVADSFHMLNDVCSLIVALQALKLAESTEASAKLSYGWQRAEVLGALINGVFLLALCFSIGMEAIARFINYTEVTNPKLIVAVGTAGLVSNIVGLFLFHDHGGHSHGGGGHSHGGASKPSTKPRSHSHSHSHSEQPSDRTPLLSGSSIAQSNSAARSPTTPSGASSTIVEDDEESELGEAEDAIEEELFVHPGELRANVLKKAHDAGYGATTTQANHKRGQSSLSSVADNGGDSHDHSHEGHGGHGDHGAETASDGNMNMRGVFLHVLGDALGNVGVIAAGLFIWLTDYEWRMYTDPGISLIITVIIFSSALPLVKSASFILLQGVPSSVPLERLRSSIAAVPGVINVHDLHVWSLSESKIVASVHIMVKGPDLVVVSREIKRRFHRFGIHSSTIQPEIVANSNEVPSIARSASHISATAAAEFGLEQEGCPVLCVDDSCRDASCCPPAPLTSVATQSVSQA
ncbi:cation diffusion facilitator family transporter [Sporobolomyces salmoneus]|uniref:cation diffusion facilitator family transporter n=1 Tax=Sporobolomyces salmoneus TaxID=183962 RepID=UPI00317BD80B